MTIRLSQGSQIAIASAYGAVKAMSAVSNANPGVATLEAAHGITDGDIYEVTSGWGRLDKRVVRADNLSTNDIDLEGVDTSDTDLYPVGSGVGSIREITSWATITQIETVNPQAPTFSFVPATTLDDVIQKEIPGLEGVSGMDFTLFYDPALSWVATIEAASDASSLVAIRITLPDGAKIYSSCYIKMSKVPQLQSGQAIKASATLRFGAVPILYAS